MMLKQAGSWTGEPVPIGVFVVGSEPAEANLLGISDEAVARPQIDVARIGEAPESVVEMLERARAALAAHREVRRIRASTCVRWMPLRARC